MLAGTGVCRDYAHLVIALLRAVNVPARLVAVYAPGCYPMDFHAVAEAYVDGMWRVVDATCLAPRQTMVRIATGRDAADTAFLDNHGGGINLTSMNVNAWVEGMLPHRLGRGTRLAGLAARRLPLVTLSRRLRATSGQSAAASTGWPRSAGRARPSTPRSDLGSRR